MNNNLQLAKNRFIERISHAGDDFGLNSFVVKLYALLYLSNRPLSLDEISEALGASKGNVSINIRELENWGAVKKLWVKGSRKDYYEAEIEIKKVLLNKVKTGIQKRLGEISNLIEEFNSNLSLSDGKLSEEDRKSVKIYKERFKKIQDLEKVIKTGLSLAEKIL